MLFAIVSTVRDQLSRVCYSAAGLHNCCCGRLRAGHGQQVSSNTTANYNSGTSTSNAKANTEAYGGTNATTNPSATNLLNDAPANAATNAATNPIVNDLNNTRANAAAAINRTANAATNLLNNARANTKNDVAIHATAIRRHLQHRDSPHNAHHILHHRHRHLHHQHKHHLLRYIYIKPYDNNRVCKQWSLPNDSG